MKATVSMIFMGSANRTAAAAVVLAISLATGCGGGDENGPDTGSTESAAARLEGFGSEARGSEAKQAEAALVRYLDARAAEEWSKACSYLLKPMRQQLGRIAIRSEEIEGESCGAGLAGLSGSLSLAERTALAGAEPESVRLDGSEGYVLYVDDDVTRFAIRAEREEGGWRFSGSPVRLR